MKRCSINKGLLVTVSGHLASFKNPSGCLGALEDLSNSSEARALPRGGDEAPRGSRLENETLLVGAL